MKNKLVKPELKSDILARVCTNENDDKTSQTLSCHIKNTLQIAEKNCQLPELKNMLSIAVLLHDIGKIDSRFQECLYKVINTKMTYFKSEYDHSIAGGKILEEKGQCLSVKMISTAVYSSHGLKDMIDFQTGKLLSEKIYEKNFVSIKSQFFNMVDKDEFNALVLKANTDCNYIHLKIHSVVQKYKNECGTDQFYLGLFERLLLSNLYDCDWRDAASFSKGHKRLKYRKNNCQQIWNDMRFQIDDYLRKSDSCSPAFLQESIKTSLGCIADKEKRIFAMADVGQTKIPLLFQFALQEAIYSEKNHIFYISLSNGALHESAAAYQKIVGCRNILEYYFGCDNVKKEQFQYYMEDWDTPVIFTNILQFLNAFYSGRKPDIRRMAALCNSIVIIDQPRSVPLFCTEVFNLAINFLSEFCNTTVIFHSDINNDVIHIRNNNLMDFKTICLRENNNSKLSSYPGIHDLTEQLKIHVPQNLHHFINEKKSDSVLISVTTRAAAKKMYMDLKENFCEYHVFLLSGAMTICNRKETAEKLALCLSQKNPVICVATDVIKAFSNLQFNYVIKNIDSLFQITFMKRFCSPDGSVCIADIDLDHAPEDPYHVIETSRYVCKHFLYEYRNNPEEYEHLDSHKSILRYDELFADERFINDITAYPIHLYGCSSTIIRLLGNNPDGQIMYQHLHRKKASGGLFQAFQTAGEKFDIIGHEGSVNVVIPHDEMSQNLLKKLPSYGIKRNQILNRLQEYVVRIPKYKFSAYAPYIHEKEGIYIWDSFYYDKEFGICTDEPDI